MAGAMSVVASAEMPALQLKPSKLRKLPTLMQHQRQPASQTLAHKTTNSASHANRVNAAAATVMAASAVSVVKAMKAKAVNQTLLKPQFLLKIQCQMRHQTKKYETKQLLKL
jgi:hypothetical protein